LAVLVFTYGHENWDTNRADGSKTETAENDTVRRVSGYRFL